MKISLSLSREYGVRMVDVLFGLGRYMNGLDEGWVLLG